MLKQMAIKQRISDRKVTTCRGDDTQTALGEISSSTMRRLDESLRPLQELRARIHEMHEITGQTISLPDPEYCAASLLMTADLNDIFCDG